jgi:hypothetical protein
MGFWVLLSFLVENGYLLVLSLSENDGYEIKEPNLTVGGVWCNF